MLPIFVLDREFEPIVLKEANHFFSIQFGNVQLLDFSNFSAEPRNLILFSKLTMRKKKQTGSFTMKGSTAPTKWIIQKFPFLSRFSFCFKTTTLSKSSFRTMKYWSTAECRRNLPWPCLNFLWYLAIGSENYPYSEELWKKLPETFGWWSNNHDVVTTLEVSEKSYNSSQWGY